MRIDLVAEDFPSPWSLNNRQYLDASWDDLLWASITVGRPNWHYVLNYGNPSLYEALFRWSLLRMAIEQRGRNGRRLFRTRAFKNLDPTEKGAVTYFLGMIFCKIFAEKCLYTPWLLHLDVFGPMVRAQLSGRSRPDLVGKQVGQDVWHAFETKGRSGKPDRTTLDKAKKQAERIASVNGTACDLSVASIMYFHGDSLRLHCRDPRADERGAHLPNPDAYWEYYYRPGYAAFSALQNTVELSAPLSGRSLDLTIKIHPKVEYLLRESRWTEAHTFADRNQELLTLAGYRADGLMVRAGPSWKEPYSEDLE